MRMPSTQTWSETGQWWQRPCRPFSAAKATLIRTRPSRRSPAPAKALTKRQWRISSPPSRSPTPSRRNSAPSPLGATRGTRLFRYFCLTISHQSGGQKFRWNNELMPPVNRVLCNYMHFAIILYYICSTKVKQ